MASITKECRLLFGLILPIPSPCHWENMKARVCLLGWADPSKPIRGASRLGSRYQHNDFCPFFWAALNCSSSPFSFLAIFCSLKTDCFMIGSFILAKTTRSEQEEDELSERVEMHCARMKECLDKGGGNLCSSGSLIRRGRGNRSKPKLTFEHWFVTTFHKHNYFIRCGRSSCRNDRPLLTTPAF